VRWKLICVGKPALPWAAAGIEDYLGRIRHFSTVEMFHVKPGTPAQEAERLLAASEGCHRVVLDERGRAWTSQQAVDYWQKLELQSVKKVAVLVGGADGHDPAVREKADHLWALGPSTLAHELALLVVCEQIYRGYSIMRGLPYHRG